VKQISQRARFLAIIFVLGAAILPVAAGQNAGGRIIGNVTDPNGATVPDAKVTIVNVATQVHFEVTTSRDGYFQSGDVPIGRYTVTIEASGFRLVSFENQNLLINQVLRLDAKLELGSKTEVIEVKDQADVVETVNPTLGASITGRTLTDMPLNGRNVLSLALLQPGVTPTNPGDSGTVNGYNIAGGRSDSVTFLLDGGLNNEQLGNQVVFNPNPDTIEEFRILENNYTAEYGRNGGGVITVVTKSGTNQWHGSGFDFIRNDAFDSNTFFNNENHIPREVLKRNQYGGTFGGPITLPHLVQGKDRFFFFVGYQGQKQTQVQTSNSIPTFTPAQLNGDFSNGGTPGNCPNADPNVATFLQANPFFQRNAAAAACAIIDPAKINGVAQKYIAAGLIATSPSGFLDSRATNKVDDNELTMKFDLNLTQKDRLAVTLGGNRSPQLNGTGSSGIGFTQAPGYPLTNVIHNYFSNFAYTRTFSSDKVNEFRVTVQRTNTLQSNPARSIPTHAELGETGITPDLELGGAALAFNDEGVNYGFSIQGPSTLIGNTFFYGDVFSWTRGHHNWKFGGNFSAYQFNTAFDFIGNGEFVFQGAGGIGSGNDFADFLFGLPLNYFQSPNARTNARSKFYAGFAQDEWRVNKKLVLTIGMRYEYSTPKEDTHGFTFNVIPGLHSTVFPNAPNGLVFPGDKGAPRGVNFPDRNDWAPRVGFAWDPQGNSKTSIRGGFGIFYDILKAEDNFQDNGQPPFFAGAGLFFNPLSGNPSQDVPNLTDPFPNAGNSIPNPFPSKPVDHNVNFLSAGILPFGNTSIFLDDPHLRTPYTYQYNFSVQREIARNTTVQVGYVGSSSHGLTSLVDINPFVPGTADRILNLLSGNSSCSADPADPRTCTYTQLLTFKNIAKASYNAVTASVTKQVSDIRFFGNAYFTFAYTYAHSIDNASGFRNNNSQVPAFATNLFRSSSDFDLRHRISFSGGWDLPFERMLSSAPKRLTQGWSLYPIVSWRTGFPLDILGQPDAGGGFTNPGVTGTGDGLQRANFSGQPVAIFDPHQSQTINGNTGNFYFNPLAFSNQ
jgi:hypothetical protein